MFRAGCGEANGTEVICTMREARVPYQKVGTDRWEHLFEGGWFESEGTVALEQAYALSRDIRRGHGAGGYLPMRNRAARP
jgi:hypothetical protein